MKTITRNLAPLHPGIHLAEEINHLGLTKTETAKALGISRQYLDRILKGSADITPRVAAHIAKAFGTTARVWLILQIDYDLWHYREENKDTLEKIKCFA